MTRTIYNRGSEDKDFDDKDQVGDDMDQDDKDYDDLDQEEWGWWWVLRLSASVSEEKLGDKGAQKREGGGLPLGKFFAIQFRFCCPTLIVLSPRSTTLTLSPLWEQCERLPAGQISGERIAATFPKSSFLCLFGAKHLIQLLTKNLDREWYS